MHLLSWAGIAALAGKPLVSWAERTAYTPTPTKATKYSTPSVASSFVRSDTAEFLAR